MISARSPLVAVLALALALPAAAQRRNWPPRRSLAELQQALRADSNDPLAYFYYGLGLWDKEKYPQADSALRQTIRLDPRDAEAYLALSYLPYAERPQLSAEEQRDRVPPAWKSRVEESDHFYQLAFRTDPLVSLRIIGFAFPGEEPQFSDYTSDESKTYDLFYAGFIDLGAGRYASAYERLQRLAVQVYREDHTPDKVPDFLLWYRALAAAHSMRYDSAIADVRRLLERSVKKEQKSDILRVPLRTNEYRFTLAVLQHQAGHDSLAVPLFQEALASDLGLYMAHVYLAGIYEQQQRLTEGLAEREQAIQANPDDFVLQDEVALARYNTGHYAEAEEAERRSVQLNPRGAFAHYVLGHVALQQGRLADAKAQFNQFLALAPAGMADYIADAKARVAALP